MSSSTALGGPSPSSPPRSFLLRHFPTFGAWVGTLGWPILLRQLRADFRKNRFFLSQLICLSVMAVAVIGMISAKVDDRNLTATQIGQDLFSVFFAIQYLIILVIFPAFSSTSFTEEKANLTMDFLLTSTLRPAEIVWGKFLASTIYCMIYVLASIPLLSIAFLFGGVNLSEVMVAYGILLGLTLWISMLGVCVSSCFTANIRSTLTMYTLVFLALAMSGWVYHSDLYPRMQNQNQSLSLVGALIDWLDPGPGLKRVAFLVVPAASFDYFFLIAANRIRPSSENKSSPLRVLTLFTVLGLVAAEVAVKLPWDSLGSPVIRLDGMEPVLELAAILLLVVTLVFSTEEAAVSRRNRARFGRWKGLLYPLRIFSPGAFWGLVYSGFLTLTLAASLLSLWTAYFASAAPPELDRRVTQSLFTLPLYLGALAALGFLLSACDFTPAYSRLTVFFVFIISLLLPVIFMLSKTPDAVWTVYYLSPITLWSSLGEIPPEAQPKFILYGFHAIDMAKAVFGAFAASFFTAGVIVAKRAGYPMLGFRQKTR